MMRKTLGVCLLVLLLTNMAAAGEMQNGSPTPPPPSQPSIIGNGSPTSSEPVSAVDETAANDWMGNDAAASLTQVALDLLAVFPALL